MTGPARRLRHRYGEEGETLVEVLVTVTLMGMAFTVILGGIGTSIISSVTQQKVTNADSIIRTAAEKVISDPYVPCASPSSYPPAPAAGYTVTVSGVEYWDGAGAFGAACPAADAGLQKVTLTVSSTGPRAPRAATLDVVKREPVPS